MTRKYYICFACGRGFGTKGEALDHCTGTHNPEALLIVQEEPPHDGSAGMFR